MANVKKPTDFVFSSDRIKWNTPEDKAAFESSGADVKQDWADEIARLLGCAACGDTEAEETATALRKAKADGWRSAADHLTGISYSDTEGTKLAKAAIEQIEIVFREIADKIEKGESNG